MSPYPRPTFFAVLQNDNTLRIDAKGPSQGCPFFIGVAIVLYPGSANPFITIPAPLGMAALADLHELVNEWRVSMGLPRMGEEAPAANEHNGNGNGNKPCGK